MTHSGARLFTLAPDQAHETLTVLAAGHGEPVDEEIASPPCAGSAVSGNGAEPSVSTAETGHAWVAVGAAAPSTATLRPIKVRVLGPIQIEVDGEEVRAGLRGKARELLALLLVYPEGVSSEFAAETLWPGAPPPRGAERLQTVVTNLRGKLRPAADTEATIVVYLQSGRRYQLEPDLIDCDLWRFQAALDADTRARQAGDRAARLAALKQAVAAYGGSFAEHEKFLWAEAPREELRRQALNAASRLAELYQQDGQLEAALAILERAITWDPYAERLYQQAMRLAAALGHRDAVQRLFDRLSDHLAEADAEPHLTTKRLLTELLGPSSTRRM